MIEINAESLRDQLRRIMTEIVEKEARGHDDDRLDYLRVRAGQIRREIENSK